MIELVVKTTNSTYPIQIGDDLLFNLDQQIATIPHSDKWTDFLLLSNETVFPLYGETVVQALQKTGKTVHYYLIPDGEQYKTWDMANQVLSFALEKRLSRQTVLVAPWRRSRWRFSWFCGVHLFAWYPLYSNSDYTISASR